MLLILFPVSLILRAVQVTVRAEAMRFVILPAAIVHITVGMNQSALAIGLIILPVALIHRAVGPDLNTCALAGLRAPKPLSFILGTIFQSDCWSYLTVPKTLLKLRIVIYKRTKLFSHLLLHSYSSHGETSVMTVMKMRKFHSTYLHIDVLVIIRVLPVHHSWLIHLVSERLDPTLG